MVVKHRAFMSVQFPYFNLLVNRHKSRMLKNTLTKTRSAPIFLTNKKGMFFTLLAIVIISIFILSFIFIPGADERRSIEKRVGTMNNFVYAVEKDLPRYLYTAGFRSIFIFEREIFEEESYINNLDEKFNELFFNGTLGGVEETLMDEVTFSEIEESLRENAGEINANVSLLNASIEIAQTNPWNVRVRLNVTFIVEDLSGLVKWNRNSVFDAYIPISNFDDPIYVMGTNGLILNKMAKANVSDWPDYALNSSYIASSSGPSFLNRLQGNFGADANGIESLVNLQELSKRGIAAKSGKSVVDYTYFSSNPVDGCVVDTGLPSWFRLDDGHLGTYGVSCVG